jgi:hypothetical protein
MDGCTEGNSRLVTIVAALAAISVTWVLAGLLNAGFHTPLGM